MTDYNFASTGAEKNTINNGLAKVKEKLDLRLPLWQKLTMGQKRALIKSGKDPILAAAWTTFKYLKNNFFGEENTNA
jgi:hypothetical protein